MEREIVKYLYEFYSQGDYGSYHSLTPILEKLDNWKDRKRFLDQVRAIIHDFTSRFYFEIKDAENNIVYWGTLKENSTEYNDYKNYPIEARFLSMGLPFIEPIIAAERQDKLDKSVKKTNTAAIINVVATIIFGIIVTYTQVQTYLNDNEKTKKEDQKEIIQQKQLEQQRQHDSILEMEVHLLQKRLLGNDTSGTKFKGSAN